MALQSLDELLKAPGLLPKSDAGRITKIQRNRRLLKGDFHELETEFAVNWFQRVADFFPEFLFSEYPDITIQRHPRFQEFFNELADEFWAELLIANGDMISFGSGILGSHPHSPFIFEAFPPDAHFEIQDITGAVTADVLIRIRGEHPDQKIDIYFYPVAGGSEWRIYNFSGGSIGEPLGVVDIPDRRGRQVIVIESGEGSIFDNMKSAVGELSTTLSGLGDSARKNSRPHLVGPTDLLKEDDEGKVELDRKGSYLPVDEGGVEPYYLTYEGPVDLSRMVYETNEKNALAFAGLSSLLFDPAQNVGNLSGRALKRLLLPFIAKLGFYSRINTKAVKSAAMILNQNLQNAGHEFFDLRKTDVSVNWKFQNVFEDINPPGDTEPDENENEGE